MVEECVQDEELAGHLYACVDYPHSYEDHLMSLVELTVLRGHLWEDIEAGLKYLEGENQPLDSLDPPRSHQVLKGSPWFDRGVHSTHLKDEDVEAAPNEGCNWNLC